MTSRPTKVTFSWAFSLGCTSEAQGTTSALPGPSPPAYLHGLHRAQAPVLLALHVEDELHTRRLPPRFRTSVMISQADGLGATPSPPEQIRIVKAPAGAVDLVGPQLPRQQAAPAEL
eukprot:scaffold731_cov261-Pinguiococcus_pyrenoidosus.AAC.65